ncbi:Beta-lactamase class C and other penicillin binding protein [Myxococcus hansupus]|uniref:Beta-lactamase class C and other penicillin binding protein n=1 Tax=Pseudomyxococcus hansupus TaxID=1297742 RepID=A0A0H4WLH7_9BACT|nr:serine hydrolase domain-containing protein [Myxococcus hansupus]AKQ63569.1 Beta-lactamase class C and other penicillin binding protein [Myxococcus hansupus]
MPHRFVAALVCALVVAPLAAPAANPELTTRLDAQLERNRARYGIAGQAVLIRHNGEVVYQAARGEKDIERHAPVSADTIFDAYSLAKLLASTLVLQLVEQGHLELDAPAGRYLPNLPVAWQDIRVRHFLNHSSGVPEYFEIHQGAVVSKVGVGFPPTLDAVFASLSDTPMRFAAGSSNRYTQTNFLVLTALLQAHHRQPYATIVRQRILKPLRLRNTWLGPAGVPAARLATAYIGKDGALQREEDVAWPAYARGHAGLHTTVGDLDRFLQALVAGKLVSRATLQTLLQPHPLSTGRDSGFVSGWELGQSGAYRQVSHDGGTRVRARVLFKDTLDGDTWTFVYFTNGSARNAWSRTLVDSTMAQVAPALFPRETLSERMFTHALADDGGDDAALNAWLRDSSGIPAKELEREINGAGYAIRENLGNGPALKVFSLNTQLHPKSANAWDSLAECHAALGDAETAATLYAKSRQLAEAAKAKP